MYRTDLYLLVARLLSDDSYRDHFFSHQDSILDDYDLTPQERAALRMLDLESVLAFREFADDQISSSLAVWYSMGPFAK